MRRVSIFACFAALLISTVVAQQVSTDIDSQPAHGGIMQRKLRAAQQVLAGVAQRDFELIERQAKSLHLLSFEAGWNRLQTKEYARLSEDFRATTVQLSRSAKEKNMDATALAYIKLSISCVECHRYARNELNPKTER
ncbi:hypothetical protein ACFL2H_07620 [Planctomycetota bacterium]